MKILMAFLLVCLSLESLASELALGVGVGVKYGGQGGGDSRLNLFPGIQARYDLDRVRLYAATGFLVAYSVGVEYKLIKNQSVSLSGGVVMMTRTLLAGHYNVYLGKREFEGLCISLGYELVDDSKEGRSKSLSANVGYYF